MPRFHRDHETRSWADLRKIGAYAYMEHPTTSIWCSSYCIDEEPVGLWWPGDPVPAVWGLAAADPDTEAFAHNNAFERLAEKYLSGPKHGFPTFALEQQRCTMVMAYAMSLPGALEDVAPALGIDLRKDAAGKRLMLQMARPRKTELAPGFKDIPFDAVRVQEMDAEGWEVYETAEGKHLARIRWWNTPEKIERLGRYCIQDTETERGVGKHLRPLKDSELALWHLDQKINDRGVNVDVALCEAAMGIVEAYSEKLDAEMRRVTNHAVTSCSNRNQVVAFVREAGLDDVDSIAKDILEEILARDDLDPVVRRVLDLRRESAKASVAKIDALLRGRSVDGKAKGLLQFLGAAATGRWSGRRFQPQNIKRPDLKDIALAIDVIGTGDLAHVSMVYDEPLSVVGDCLRGMIKASDGCRLIAADYSNIEGRVLAWLAGETTKLQRFRDFDAGVGHDIYKITAGDILAKDPAAVTDKERQGYGKVPELALGYQGGYGAFVTMGANYGVNLPEDEVLRIRDGWRAAHPNIKQFWYDMEETAIAAVNAPGTTQWCRDIAYRKAGSFLFMRLPSKRFLAYPYPEIRMVEVPWKKKDPEWVRCDDEGEALFLYGDDLVKFEAKNKRALVYANAKKPQLSYFSTIDFSKKAKIVDDPNNTSKWARIGTYGGMLVENCTQAVARDFMAHSMPLLEDAGYPIVLTVHDEIICDVPNGHGSVGEMETLMATLPEWGAGCPVVAEGWEGERYRK